MNIEYYPSPNFRDRGDARIQAVVIHYTDMPTLQDALDILTDPASEVSAHYLISRQGTIYQLVQEHYCAWHAGLSYWAGLRNINDISLGIELENRGHSHGMEEFPKAQIDALCELLYKIRLDYTIYPNYVIGHSDAAPGRKLDPGPLFDWRLLARHSHILWPRPSLHEREASPDELLYAIGYDPEASLHDKMVAFQARFNPKNITGEVSGDDIQLMNGLLDLYDMLYS